MTVSEFVKEYTALKTEEEKKDCLKRHVRRHYVPFVEKGDMADRAVKAANFIGGKYKKHSSIAGMYHDIDVVNAYTDIEIPMILDGEVVGAEMLDELKAALTGGCLDFDEAMYQAIGHDVWEFDDVFESACDDLEFNETSAYAINTMTAERIENVLKQLGESFEAALKDKDISALIDNIMV